MTTLHRSSPLEIKEMREAYDNKLKDLERYERRLKKSNTGRDLAGGVDDNEEQVIYNHNCHCPRPFDLLALLFMHSYPVAIACVP